MTLRAGRWDLGEKRWAGRRGCAWVLLCFALLGPTGLRAKAEGVQRVCSLLCSLPCSWVGVQWVHSGHAALHTAGWACSGCAASHAAGWVCSRCAAGVQPHTQQACSEYAVRVQWGAAGAPSKGRACSRSLHPAEPAAITHGRVPPCRVPRSGFVTAWGWRRGLPPPGLHPGLSQAPQGRGTCCRQSPDFLSFAATSWNNYFF